MTDVMMIGLRTVGGGQGGVETHVDNLAQELDQLGLSVLVAVRSPYAGNTSWSRGKATSFKPIWAPRHLALEAIGHSFLAAAYAIALRPKIVHIHALGPSIVTPLLRLAGLHVVVTHHGEDYNREKWGAFAKTVLKLGELFQARFANQRICVSKSLSNRLRKSLNVSFEYIPNGVPKPNRTLDTNELERFGIKPGKYILNVSRLVPEKRHMDLIAAFQHMAVDDLQLVLVGAADHQSAYAKNVQNAAENTANVISAGFQNGATLQQIYSNAAVFCLPSSHEGLPIALLEAMSFSREVVVSDIPANLDIGLPSANYHELGNVTDIAEKLKLAASRSASENNQTDWSYLLAEYDWKNVAERTCKIYQQANPTLKLFFDARRISA